MNILSQRIVADIGGTNARFAYLREGEDKLEAVMTFPCADYNLLEDAVRAYMAQANITKLSEICLAVASALDSDLVNMLNNHWSFSRSELERSLGVPLTVINDFTAQALCLDYLAEDELHWIGSARPRGGQIRLILGPGTGLGVAALVPGSTFGGKPEETIVPSEGGHVAFAPTTPHQVDLLQTMWSRHQRISVERLLSGQGLENLYWANALLQGEERELPAPEVTAGAKAGDPLCRTAIEDFLDILAAVAGDMALMMWSVDGVYLSGGILPELKAFFDEKKFRLRFEDKGRYQSFFASIPIAQVCAEHPGLLGCSIALKNKDRGRK